MTIDGVYRKGFHKRDRFNRLKHPGKAYRSFKENRDRIGGTWREFNAAYRKRRKLARIARASRKANR